MDLAAGAAKKAAEVVLVMAAVLEMVGWHGPVVASVVAALRVR